jgi:hypothetical protein
VRIAPDDIAAAGINISVVIKRIIRRDRSVFVDAKCFPERVGQLRCIIDAGIGLAGTQVADRELNHYGLKVHRFKTQRNEIPTQG